MKKIVVALTLVVLFSQSCKTKTTEKEQNENPSTDSVAAFIKNADSLLAIVNTEWKYYTDLDSAKYKDLKGVYFQIKNTSSPDMKKIAELEKLTKSYQDKNITLDMPNFINEFYSYDSLLMLHVKDVLAFAAATKGSEKLAGLKQLNESLSDEVSDDVFVKVQSHLFNAIEIYNNYLKAHPAVIEKTKNHKLLQQNNQFSGSDAKPVS